MEMTERHDLIGAGAFLGLLQTEFIYMKSDIEASRQRIPIILTIPPQVFTTVKSRKDHARLFVYFHTMSFLPFVPGGMVNAPCHEKSIP